MTALVVQFDPAAARFGAARTQKRIEDDRLLAGRGLYSDNRAFAGLAHLAILRSPHAHARIAALDLAGARAAPGVLAAWSIDDLKAAGVGHIPFPPVFRQADGRPMSAPPRHALADGTVYCVGQPVAAVVAETREQALDALEAVAVEFDALPCLVDMRRALAPGAPQLWPDAPGNVAAEARYGDAGAVTAAFAGAAHVTHLELHNQRLIAMAIEPRCAIGAVEAGRTVLYTQSQTPSGARDLLAVALGAEPAAVRVVVGDIGGGFGMKTGLTPEELLVCQAARVLGRPVKWRGDRSEEFLGAHMGRDQFFRASLGFDGEGGILGLRMDMLGNFGAVPVGSTAIIPLALGPKVQTTVYQVPAIDYRIRGVLTNTMATGAYRGAGRPEANYLMERLIEQGAREMGLDPVEVRRRNFIRPAQLPYRTPLGDVYDSGDFDRVLRSLLTAADWAGFDARAAASRARARLRGRGLACYLEWTGAIPTETVDILVDAEGNVTVFSGTQAMGQGLETTYTQLVVEVLGIEARSVRIVQGDTDLANGVGSVGSRSAFVGGSAVVAASHDLVRKGRELAAEALEAAAADIEYRDGRFIVAGTDRGIALGELAARQPTRHFRVANTQTPSAPSWPNGAQAIEVEIDPDTGAVEVVKVTSVDDLGRVINRMIVEGQVHGGVAQGVGQALFEGAEYDPASGQLLTGSLMDYCVPRADDLPAMSASFDESSPCRTNLLGVKGCGEIGTIGATPATVLAVLDALAPHGVRHLEMPLRAERVWRALRQAD